MSRMPGHGPGPRPSALLACALLVLCPGLAASATPTGPDISIRTDFVSSGFRGLELVTTVRVTVHNPGPASILEAGFGTCYDNSHPAFDIRPAQHDGCAQGGAICFMGGEGWKTGEVPPGADASCHLELVASDPYPSESRTWPIRLSGEYVAIPGGYVHDTTRENDEAVLVFQDQASAIPALGGAATIVLGAAIVGLVWLRARAARRRAAHAPGIGV